MKKSRERGQSIIELSVGLMALIPIMLVIFDLAVIVIGVQINDSTCREAARVAASGDPMQAKARAAAVVVRANAKANGMLSNFTLTSVNALNANTPPAAITQSDMDKLKPYGGSVQGSVTVQTEVDVKPFVVQMAYNGKSPLKFSAKQTFPFTYVVPNQAQVNTPSGQLPTGWGSGPALPGHKSFGFANSALKRSNAQNPHGACVGRE